MTCIRCEVTRAKLVAKTMHAFGKSIHTIADYLNKTLEGTYEVECFGEGLTHIRIVRCNPVPPHVDYVILSEELPF